VKRTLKFATSLLIFVISKQQGYANNFRAWVSLPWFDSSIGAGSRRGTYPHWHL